jgi:hypothetical protein
MSGLFGSPALSGGVAYFRPGRNFPSRNSTTSTTRTTTMMVHNMASPMMGGYVARGDDVLYSGDTGALAQSRRRVPGGCFRPEIPRNPQENSPTNTTKTTASATQKNITPG